MRTSHFGPFLGLLFLTTACQSTSQRQVPEVYTLLENGDFEQALAVAEEDRRLYPNDPGAQLAWRNATVGWHMDRGRTLSFDGQDHRALAEFQRASELAPDLESPPVWIAKTRQKLADKSAEVALDQLLVGDLEGAVGSYRAALEFDPDHRQSLAGLEEVERRRTWRAERADTHYNRGVRALSQSWLDLANWRFTSTLKYDEGRPAAERRLGQTEVDLADRSLVLASELEAGEHFEAALREYKKGLALVPGYPPAVRGLERTSIEAEVAQLQRDAHIKRLRGQFDESRALLHVAASLTERQGEAVQTALEGIEEAELDAIYQQALDYADDYRFEESLAVFDSLLEGRGFFRDALSRRDTLADYIERAPEYYAQAAAASDPAERERYLRQIELFWPEYLDVQEQLIDMRQAREALMRAEAEAADSGV